MSIHGQHPLSPALLIERVVTLLQDQFKENDIELKTNPADIRIVVDPDLMQRVLINILLNAAAVVSGATAPRIAIGAFKLDEDVSSRDIHHSSNLTTPSCNGDNISHSVPRFTSTI